MVHYRVMHRKRVTSELHDSYFRLMTIKHSISKIEWASIDYIIQLSSTSQSSCQERSRLLETRLGRESHTRPRWGLGNPDGVDPSTRRTRKTQRDGHNSGVKMLQFMFDLQLPLTCKPWTTLSNPCNKVRGKILLKKFSCDLIYCVSMYPVYICIWEYNIGSIQYPD